MSEKDEKKPQVETKELHHSVETILKERMRLEDERKKLDQMIKDQYTKDISVMFTDLKGSTAFFETHGDIEGRAHIETHNRVLFPIIEKHSGKIIKTIGDAIMAMFEDPQKAVLAAMEMQNTLASHNKTIDQKYKEIHIRIGLNFGPGVVEEKDVFGDVVNVAARVESKCDPGQILISDSLYQAVRHNEDILCRFFGEVDVKGKAEQVRLYRVIYNEQQLVAEEQFKTAGVRRIKEKKPGADMVVELNLSREGAKIKVSAIERHIGQEKTVQQYQTVKINEESVRQQCGKVVSLLNQANRRGKLSKEILKQMQEVGQSLYDQLLPREAKEKLEKSQAQNLLIRMDDQLVQIPWELLYNGAEFLCLRFNIGRMVSTRQKVTEAQQRMISHPLKMLALADPRGDLPESAREGALLRDEMDHFPDLINVNLKVSKVDKNYILSRIRDYDLIHYAGHADYDAKNPSESGWLLSDGKLRAEEIANLTGKKPMPVLVFANGCQSGQTEAWKISDDYEDQIFGLANAFLVSGVQHYVGTFWEILDEPGREFAIAFYREIFEGASVGEAVRLARKHLIDKYGEETIVWASYMLYGDPSFSYLAKAEPRAKEEAHISEAKFQPEEMQLRGATTATMSAQKSGLGKWVGIGAVLLVAVLAGFYFLKGGVSVQVPEDAIAAAYAQLQKGDLKSAESSFAGLSQKRGDAKARGFEGLSAVAFQRNDLSAAKDNAGKALAMDPQSIYSHVILGNVAYNQGDLAGAENEYRAAVASVNGKPWMKSEAYNRLGRIYSENGNDQGALQNYQEAVSSDPKNADASVNLGQKFLALGKTAEAQTAFKQGADASPNNGALTMLMAEAMRRSQEAVLEKERADQINQEINQLVQRFKEGKISAPAAQDEWTSRPVTLAFIDFETKGKGGMMEGEDDFLRLAITNALKDSGRVKVVEREKLDKIVQELNLSSSQLANDETRLQLGKLFSARLIASGSIIRYGGKVQVSLRLIETETSEVKVAVTPDPFPETAAPSEIANTLVKELTAKIQKAYPVRGEVVQVNNNEAVLNVGSDAGLKAGTKILYLEEKKVKIGNKLSSSRFDVGTGEVTRVEKQLGYASAEKPKAPLKVGIKFEEITE